MKDTRVLMVDAGINLILGFFLIIFSEKVIHRLGVPGAEPYFYPNIPGGVLLGIGIALLIGCFWGPSGSGGLGLGGATAIDICAGLVLSAWLIFNKPSIPLRGKFPFGPWFLS